MNSYSSDRVRSIPVDIILTLITCGIYNLYWNYKQMESCNELLGRNEFSWGTWFLLSLITCGIYHIYYQYKMGEALFLIEKSENVPVFDNLPMVSLLGTLFGFSIVVDAIHQDQINKIYEAKNRAVVS